MADRSNRSIDHSAGRNNVVGLKAEIIEMTRRVNHSIKPTPSLQAERKLPQYSNISLKRDFAPYLAKLNKVKASNNSSLAISAIYQESTSVPNSSRIGLGKIN